MNSSVFAADESPMSLPPGLLMTGTDTGVGKTYVTALIARQLRAEGRRVGVYKPACSGAERSRTGERHWPDLDLLADAAGVDDLNRICPQRFLAPLAPPVAAAAEGRTVDRTLLLSGAAAWQGQCDVLLIEGVGGLLCPLTDDSDVADFAVQIGLPLVIVGRLGLGTINHTLLTLEAAERRGLAVAGWLLNDAVPDAGDSSTRGNCREIAKRTSHRCLGMLSPHADTPALEDGRVGRIDWWSLANNVPCA